MIYGAVGLAGIIVASIFSVLDYLESRKKAKTDRAAETSQGDKHRLDGVFGPLLYYLDVTRALYTPFRATKPEGFRTLTYPLNPEQTYEVAGGGGVVELHVHLPAPEGGTVGLSARRADSPADDGDVATRPSAARPLASGSPGQGGGL